MNTSLDRFTSPPTKMTNQLDFILLDGSGSMQASLWWPMCKALDDYVDTLREMNTRTHLLLTVFDTTDMELVQRNCLIDDWKSLISDPIGAHFGGTPLFDAIQLMCRKLRDLDPPRCSITIVTDGDECDSRFTSEAQARALLDWCRAKGWQVTFMGCDFNNSKLGAALGASEQNTIGVQKKLLGDAARTLAKKRANYGLFGEEINFSEDERNQFGGYLAPPKS